MDMLETYEGLAKAGWNINPARILNDAAKARKRGLIQAAKSMVRAARAMRLRY